VGPLLRTCIVSRDYCELTCLMSLGAADLDCRRGGLGRGLLDVMEVGVAMHQSTSCSLGVGCNRDTHCRVHQCACVPTPKPTRIRPRNLSIGSQPTVIHLPKHKSTGVMIHAWMPCRFRGGASEPRIGLHHQPAIDMHDARYKAWHSLWSI
jgi:hypothetical protein